MKIIVCPVLKNCDKGFGQCPCSCGKVAFDNPVDAVLFLHDSDSVSVSPVTISDKEGNINE